MGLKVRLPHSFSQISERMSSRTRDLKPASANRPETMRTRSESRPSSSPTGKRLPSMCRMTPGLCDLGRRIGDAADDPPRVDRPEQHAAGVHRFDDAARVVAVDLLEVPPGDAVLQGHDDRVGTEQGRQVVDHRDDLMRLQGE